MTESPRTLGLLPVRGGSQGLIGKNSKPLRGRPLMGWAAQALGQASGVDLAYCSTDSPQLAEIARQYGLAAPSLRPEKLAGPDSLVADTVSFVLDELSKDGLEFAQVVIVQATSPFVTARDITDVVRELSKPEVDSVVTVARVPDDYHPSLMYQSVNGSLSIAANASESFVRRQDRSPWFRRVGLALGFGVQPFLQTGSFLGPVVHTIEVETDRAVNIDDAADFAAAERLGEMYL